ncbi:sulfotransferase [Qipengyuania sp. SS22]|uniref:tetratricopeptide repeat-containing sulfotransferase family protein n=1 Tax=Qipengyuania sp. SS22 TaxID=2979461 RepID=UPI0021E60AB6|nr:sulfotransferase [Qipengyuania sp. SS22]UYH55778.1 sulfotransferase [Qipengyuania sp. SS22]
MADTVDALARKAAALYRSARYDDAREAYRDLLALHPNRADDWVNFGLLLKRQGAFREALAAYDNALQHQVTGPEEVHLNRAVVLADDLADPASAHAALEAALAIRPHYVPALLNLGNLHEDAGDRDRARTVYARALELEPGSALALMRLAEVTVFDDPGHPLIERLRGAIARIDLGPLERADLGYALGRALDQCARYDEAFAAYRTANQGSRALAANPYDPQGAQAFIDRLIAAFPDAAEKEAGADLAPVFICGMFRSGSTLVERVLASHSRVIAGGELPLLPHIVREQLQPYPESLVGRDAAFYASLRQRYLKGLDEMELPIAGLTDKRPDNFLHVGLIKRIFPNARIVLTRRNPLDNCLSIYFAHLDPTLTYAASLESAAHWYEQYERLADHWMGLYPDDIHIADYDAIVADPEAEIAGLLSFLDLEWEDACLTPHRGTDQVRTASAWQVREPLYTRSCNRWRNYAAHLESLVATFGEPGRA